MKLIVWLALKIKEYVREHERDWKKYIIFEVKVFLWIKHRHYKKVTYSLTILLFWNEGKAIQFPKNIFVIGNEMGQSSY